MRCIITFMLVSVSKAGGTCSQLGELQGASIIFIVNISKLLSQFLSQGTNLSKIRKLRINLDLSKIFKSNLKISILLQLHYIDAGKKEVFSSLICFS